MKSKFSALCFCIMMMSACNRAPQSEIAKASPGRSPSCGMELFVLGAGQDAGAPQIGNVNDPAWADPALRMLPTSIGIVDHKRGERYLFEATPSITEQMYAFDQYAPPEKGQLGLSGVFVTHAHIGHYAGLIYFGREVAGAKNLPVYTMPRMAEFLRSNGPWAQLVDLENIKLEELHDQNLTVLSEDLSITPFRVPHRDEYSETVGFVIDAPLRSILFVPDIDSWQEWETDFDIRIEDMIKGVDVAYLDASFFDDNELPGRDMSQIPHPRVAASMDRFDSLQAADRAKVHFIHFNHTNPTRDPASPETAEVLNRGYKIARRGDRLCLGG